ncbi:MAG: diguanylate cyclase [Spirochaetales bacterium]
MRSEAEQAGSNEDLAWSFRKEAQCAFLENHLESARENAFSAAKYARLSKNAKEEAEAYNSLGIIFGQKGALKQAVEYFKKSYALHESSGTENGATVLNNIGRIYELMAEYDRALEYFQAALSDLREHRAEPNLEGTMLGNIGRALSDLGRRDEAVSVLRESISVFERNELEVPRVHALAKLADAISAPPFESSQEEKDQAEALYREAIETNTARSEQSWTHELYGKLGSLLAVEGRYEEAKPLLEAAIEGILEEHTSVEVEGEWRSRYSEVLEHSGDLRGALREKRLAYAALDRNYRSKLENRLHEALSVVELRRLESEYVDLAFKARHDPLTALLNRGAFTARLHEEMLRARRYNRNLALVMLDIDHFKAVNDTIGHIGADQVLIGTAQLLVTQTRSSDTVARYGGEEIAIILPETAPEQAYAFCEKLRVRIQTMDWSSLGITTPVTSSMGISNLQPDDTMEEMLERADAMLYRAKAAGRNTVVLEDPA